MLFTRLPVRFDRQGRDRLPVPSLILNIEIAGSAVTRRLPCSAFKIVSSLTALEHGILEPEDSTRMWSGEVFWNKDIDFSEAFHTSCVWYFRQLIDDIGKEMLQEELENLQKKHKRN